MLLSQIRRKGRVNINLGNKSYTKTWRQLVESLSRWCQHLCWKARCNQMENCIFNPWGHNDMSSLHLIALLSELIVCPAVTSVITFISIIKLNLICLVCMPLSFCRSEILQTAVIHIVVIPRWIWNQICIASLSFSPSFALHSATKSRRRSRDELWGNQWLSHGSIRAAESKGVKCRFIAELFPFWRGVLPVTPCILCRCQSSLPTDSCCVPLHGLMSSSSAFFVHCSMRMPSHSGCVIAAGCTTANCRAEQLPWSCCLGRQLSACSSASLQKETIQPMLV